MYRSWLFFLIFTCLSRFDFVILFWLVCLIWLWDNWLRLLWGYILNLIYLLWYLLSLLFVLLLFIWNQIQAFLSTLNLLLRVSRKGINLKWHICFLYINLPLLLCSQKKIATMKLIIVRLFISTYRDLRSGILLTKGLKIWRKRICYQTVRYCLSVWREIWCRCCVWRRERERI